METLRIYFSLTSSVKTALHFVKGIAEFYLANFAEVLALCKQFAVRSVRDQLAAVHNKYFVVLVYQLA